jgi:hypothetical protein
MAIIHDMRKIFGRITPLQTAANELAEAELALLRAETGVEYATAQVSFNRQRVKRLRAFIAAESTKELTA